MRLFQINCYSTETLGVKLETLQMSPAHLKLEVVLDPTVKDRAPPSTSWSMQDYTNPQSCFRTFCYFSAHALPTLLFPIFSQNVFCTCL